jgi:hypothetical protein
MEELATALVPLLNGGILVQTGRLRGRRVLRRALR